MNNVAIKQSVQETKTVQKMPKPPIECVPAIYAQSLTKSLGGRHLISDFSVSLTKPSITGLMGRNGSGKTTLLRMCAGLTLPSSGTLQIWGSNPVNNLDVLRRLIYSRPDVTYSRGLYLDQIIDDYALVFANFDKAFAGRVMAHFNMDSNQSYHSLSQGEKSTFNLLCALATRAPLTMLDEPTLGMDIPTQKAAFELLSFEQAQHPRNFLIAGHLISDILTLLDDLIIINKGSVSIHDSLENLHHYAYRVEGERAALDSFASGKKILHKDFGELRSSLVIVGSANDEIIAQAQTAQLQLSAILMEDLYTYLSSDHLNSDQERGELPCLW